jgi:hypothetical protein
MTRPATPALRLKRRRRRFIAGLAFAAMALPAAGVAAPYQVPNSPSDSASSYQLPSNFKSDSASDSSSASSGTLPSSFKSENASDSSSASSGTLPSSFKSENASNGSPSSSSASSATLSPNFHSDAADGYAQQPSPATVVRAENPNGFDWGDAGIGAASIVGLLALGGGMTLLVSHNRRRSTPGSTAVA